jgi:hypothetical protein
MGWNTADRSKDVVFLLLVYYFDMSRLIDWNFSFLLGEDPRSDFG